MAEWKCLTAVEEELIRSLGYDPEHLVVNRVGEGRLVFLNMRSRAELIVTVPERGRPTVSVYQPTVTPPRRAWMR